MFNDPFDSQLNISFGNNASYLQVIRQQIMDEFGGKEEDNNRLGELIDKWISENQRRMEESKQGWVQYAKWIRIFSMTERNDDLLMWAHYAECHKGVVFCFRIGESINNPQRITYSENIPPMALSVLDFAEDMSGTQKPFDYDNFFFNNIFTKSKHWEYEQEWRCASFINDKKDLNSETLIELKPISCHEILSIYLGCLMEENIKDEVVRLARQKIPQVKIYEAMKHESQFALTFNQVN